MYKIEYRMAFTFKQCKDFERGFKNQGHVASAPCQRRLSGGVLECCSVGPKATRLERARQREMPLTSLTWEGWGPGWRRTMTGKALWVERSHDFLGLCPFGTRCPCCSVPFRRKEKPSWHRLARRSICPRDKANRLLRKDHSPEPWGADPLPRDVLSPLSVLWVPQLRAKCEGNCPHQAGLYDTATSFTHPGASLPTTLSTFSLVLGL